MCGFFFGLTGLVITHLVSGKLTMLVVMEDVHFLLLEPKLVRCLLFYFSTTGHI
ncbi:hypothetical protein HanXRQr2_Chr10g0452401 [Helianthus annuus]|uniref:Uncharacterized protein n=1 Tax=Helianthus annuus TaxID=4232 RepID=A0A9K3HZW2_HELAN|nr:hypothetical protein HanXRQr2_Chr10g0452401 [Helianthus annuus]KAJ0884680.1 hypothetical protein HanPSC8_Chr10g0436641 [Helianthus annuus]